MDSTSDSNHVAEARMTTGIPGLDEILMGGLITGRSYLVAGGPGAGKTILSMQWLREVQRRGDRTLYITLTEPANEIARNMKAFDWGLEGIELRDFTPSGDMPNGEYQIFPPSEVEQIPVWRQIYQAVNETHPQCVVIDSVTQLRYLSTDEYQFRKMILGLVGFLNRSGCTSFLTFESSELERETAVKLAVDGSIRLRSEISPSRVIALRTVQVEKFRGSDFISGLHPFRFKDDGIHIYPHRIEAIGGIEPALRQLSSGIEALDALLGGGLESNTSTIITGPSGVGKTTLGTEFLRTAVARGERAVLFAFEEPREFLLMRARALNAPLDPLIENGSLSIVRLNPMQQYPDEFLSLVRSAVEQDGRTLVMIDSLRGYQLEMEQYGSTLAHIHNLVHYLYGKGVTSLLINEVEAITGDVRATELGISHLADNIILMRYAESQGRVVKVIACLKKRLGGFQTELREYMITAQGLAVGEKLDRLHGILTGVPEWHREQQDTV